MKEKKKQQINTQMHRFSFKILIKMIETANNNSMQSIYRCIVKHAASKKLTKKKTKQKNNEYATYSISHYTNNT